MSDDLITRLTWVAADDGPNCGAIRHEAAAEIRRLLGELAIADRALEKYADLSNWVVVGAEEYEEPAYDGFWNLKENGWETATEALAAMRQRKAVE